MKKAMLLGVLLGALYVVCGGRAFGADVVTSITPNGDGSTTIVITCSNTSAEIAASKTAAALPGAVKASIIAAFGQSMIPHLYAAVENLKAGPPLTSTQVDVAAAAQTAAIAQKASDLKAAQAIVVGDPTK